MKKALVVHSRGIDDMGDLLQIARAEGRKAFHTNNNVHVYPWIKKIGDCFVVMVDDGCSNAQVQGRDGVRV